MICDKCKKQEFEEILYKKNVPIFQNKVYDTYDEALNCKKSHIRLMQCKNCNFIFNSEFKPEIMDYDQDYHNEQENSKLFLNHLDSAMDIVTSLNPKKIIEIGCGKGTFLNMLLKKGYDVIGFDPAYEGGSKFIKKEYYSKDYPITADLIILRHTLEHIKNPFSFLRSISNTNSKIYVEIPSMDWIIKKKAFWDIHYEHCNYFLEYTLNNIFDNYKCIPLFDNQYFGLVGKLKNILYNKNLSNKFNININFLKESFIKKDILKYKNVYIWGAGAKGNTFLNTIKNFNFIRGVIDINIKKQNKFIGGTGHKIISPKEIPLNIDLIIVMNDIYIDEIKKITSNKYKIISLGDIYE